LEIKGGIMKIKKKELEKTICIGIDPSLNGTGIVVMENFKVLDYFFFTNIINNSKTKHAILNRETGIERLYIIQQWFYEFLNNYQPDYAAIENYAFGAKGNSVFQIGGLGEALRLCLYSSGIPYKEYEPARVKKYAIGKGNAEKSEMVVAALKDGFDVSQYGKNGEDLADAYWIAQMLNNEIFMHKNKDYLETLNSKRKEIFLETTKAFPIPLINRQFIRKK
jgi:Holliday junction resolvasome RuvABC endonuclease subunit